MAIADRDSISLFRYELARLLEVQHGFKATPFRALPKSAFEPETAKLSWHEVMQLLWPPNPSGGKPCCCACDSDHSQMVLGLLPLRSCSIAGHTPRTPVYPSCPRMPIPLKATLIYTHGSDQRQQPCQFPGRDRSR